MIRDKNYWKRLSYFKQAVDSYSRRTNQSLNRYQVAALISILMDNSYRKVTDKSVTITFKLKDEDVYALAWTTTPWTLPSNLGLTVHPDLVYAYVNDHSDGKVYLLAKDLISKFYKFENEYSIIFILSYFAIVHLKLAIFQSNRDEILSEFRETSRKC